MITYPIAWFGWFRPRDRLADVVAELLLVGFHGASPSSPSARLLARQVRRGQAGGIFFMAQNIGSTEEMAALLRLFREGGATPLLAIDHEGGVVIARSREPGSALNPGEAVYTLVAPDSPLGAGLCR